MDVIGRLRRQASLITALPFPEFSFPEFSLPQLTIPPFPTLAAELVESFKALEGINQQFAGIAKALGALDRKLFEYADQARTLGRCGWTLPLNMAMTAIPDLLEGIEVDSDYDGAFEQLYTDHEGQEFKTLLRDLVANKDLAPWHGLLTECAECYSDRRFRVIVPALLTVFEGAFAMATDSLRRRIDPKAVSASRRKNAVRGVDMLIWASLEGFVGELFRDHRFSDNAPTRTNRHWILHGRAAAEWPRADALRLFQAIHTVT